MEEFKWREGDFLDRNRIVAARHLHPLPNCAAELA